MDNYKIKGNSESELYQHLGSVLDSFTGCIKYQSAGIFLIEEKLNLIVKRGSIIEKFIWDILETPQFDLALIKQKELISNQKLPTDILSQPLVSYLNQGNLTKIIDNQISLSNHIFLPLQTSKQLLGLILFVKKENNKITKKEFDQVKIFSELISLLIDNEHQLIDAQRNASEINAIITVQKALTSRLELEPVLQLIADEARRLTNTRTSILMIVHGEMLRAEAISGIYSPDVYLGYEIPINKSFTGSSVLTGKPVWVTDADDNPNVYKGDHLQVKSFISIPLIFESKPIGAIMVADKLSGKFGKDDEQITKMLADSAVIAVENARLYQKEQERRHEAENRQRVAEGLRELLKVLNSQQPSREIFNLITEQACQLLRSNASSIVLIDEDENKNIIESSYGFEGTFENPSDIINNLKEFHASFTMDIPIIITLELEIIKVNNNPSDIIIERLKSENKTNDFQTIIAIPLTSEEIKYGKLLLFYREKFEYSKEKIDLAKLVGYHASLAIKNSFLQKQVDELARLHERQRIAQSLHDSVAQLLFSMGLEVESLLDKYKDYDQFEKSLQTIRKLTSRSSQELRNAIFTLREVHQTKNKYGLKTLIEEVVLEFRIQTGIAITFIAPEEVPPLKPSTNDAIYGIVREALSNISKHSKASAVIVNLSYDDQYIQILVQDDGQGIIQKPETQEENSLHFGVAMMKELVRQVQGEFLIKNGDEQGVVIKAKFRLNGEVN